MTRTLSILALTTLLFAAGPSAGADAPAPQPAAPPPRVVADLDQAIRATINHPQYTWRMPRMEVEQEAGTQGMFARFLDQIGAWMERALHALERLAHWLQRWIGRWFPEHEEPKAPGIGWQTPVQVMLFVVLAVTAAALALLVWRTLRQRRRPQPVIAAAVPAEQLLQESVRPDRMSSDEWMDMARDLVARGELRLALRAMFLGCLATLARCRRISVARYKSNRDYLREFQRRARELPDAANALAHNVQALERVWYGNHPATLTTVDQFAANQQVVLGAVAAAAQLPGTGAS